MIGVSGNVSDRNVRRRRGGSAALHNARQPRQRRNRLMLEHRARRDHQPRLARPAHQLDRDDAVAPQRKEVVVDPDPLEPQHLGKQPAQDLLLRRARRPPGRSARPLRRRQRAAVELAVRRQRKPLQNHKRRRNHVVRKAPRQMPPQPLRIRARVRRAPPHSQPAACRPTHPRAQSPPPAPPPHAPAAPPRSRPAQCGTRAASPAHPRAPGNPEPRPSASAPGRRCGTSGSRNPQTGPRQTAPPSAPRRPT